jgi:hypothetical protein
MDKQNAVSVLRRLEQRHVAPKGEQALDVERAASPGETTPEPVLLLTNAALYARAHAQSWTRLPLNRIKKVTVNTDATGMLTRYGVEDDGGQVHVDLALPMACVSFRERMRELAERGPVVLPTPEVRPVAARVVHATSFGIPAIRVA